MRYTKVTESRNVVWGHCTFEDHEVGKILSAAVGPAYINLHPECELPCSNDFKDKQTVRSKMFCCFWSNTLEFTPIVCS